MLRLILMDCGVVDTWLLLISVLDFFRSVRHNQHVCSIIGNESVDFIV